MAGASKLDLVGCSCSWMTGMSKLDLVGCSCSWVAGASKLDLVGCSVAGWLEQACLFALAAEGQGQESHMTEEVCPKLGSKTLSLLSFHFF